MDEFRGNFLPQDRRLSILDVSYEDDSLYNSPSRDCHPLHLPDNQSEQKTIGFSGFSDTNSADALEGEDRVSQSSESFEPEGTRRQGKYNLRKSLAWDSAFFTSAGVLEPEELSSMIGGIQKVGKHRLPGIEEDVHRSTDSISTLASDTLALDAIEGDLFGDIRASIQKSSKVSQVTKSSDEVGNAIPESQIIQSSNDADSAPSNKLKTKPTPKNPNVVVQASRKITNQAPVCPQTSQSIAACRESTSSLCKPPKVVGGVSPIFMAASKRASLGANRIKIEKVNKKSSTGNSVSGRVKISASGVSQNTVPRPTLPSKTSIGSSEAAKTEFPTSASSSFDSSGSLSSDSSRKSSLSSVKRKVDDRTGNCSSGSTAKPKLKITSRHKNQTTSSHLSPYLKSVTKASSSISPASSISEWSSESVSPTSTLNKRSNSSKAGTSSCKDSPGDGIASQVSDSESHSNRKFSVGRGPQVTGIQGGSTKRISTGSNAFVSDSNKPSGLRMPSPKIGFFDGAKPAVRTPNGSMQSHLAVPSGVLKVRAGSVSPSGGSNGTKLGKSGAAITAGAGRSTKVGAQLPALGLKPKSPLPLQEPSNAAAKVASASRCERRPPGTSMKVNDKSTSEYGGKGDIKAENFEFKEGNQASGNPDLDSAKGNGSFCLLKDKMSSETAACIPSSLSEVDNLTMSQKVGDGTMCGRNYVRDDLQNGKGTCSEYQIDHLTKQLGGMDIQRDIEKTCSTPTSGLTEELENTAEAAHEKR